jgi:hypothetical protein
MAYRFILLAAAAVAAGAWCGSARSQPIADTPLPVPLVWNGTDLAARTPGEPDLAVVILLEIRAVIGVYMAGATPRPAAPAPHPAPSIQVGAQR